MLEVKSFSVALFTVARGIKPVEVNVTGPTPVFIFSDEAKAALREYRTAKNAVEVLVEDAQAELEAQLDTLDTLKDVKTGGQS